MGKVAQNHLGRRIYEGCEMVADVSARIAWPEDAPAIAALQLASWRTNFASVLVSGELDEVGETDLTDQWTQIIGRSREARVRALVALERATVRGFALVHPSHDDDSDQIIDGEVGEFVISPDHRNEGHGSRLLQACADTLRADGFRRAVWWVTSTDDELRAFAEAAGWAPDGAHRELASESDARLKQIRLHTALM